MNDLPKPLRTKAEVATKSDIRVILSSSWCIAKKLQEPEVQASPTIIVKLATPLSYDVHMQVHTPRFSPTTIDNLDNFFQIGTIFLPSFINLLKTHVYEKSTILLGN